MTKSPENIHVAGIYAGNAAANFEMDGARYHIWFNIDTMEPQSTLYKNPPHGVNRHTPGHFDTRHLDATNKKNKPLVDALFAHIREHGLLEAAIGKEAAKKAQQDAEIMDAYRRKVKERAGPDLYDALRGLLDAEGDGYLPPENDPRMKAARAALAKAEKG